MLPISEKGKVAISCHLIPGESRHEAVRRQVFLVNFLVFCQKVSNMLAFFT